MRRRKTTLPEDILSLLIDQKAPYRILYRLMEGYYERSGATMPSESVLRNALSRLKKNGLVVQSGTDWTATGKGARKINDSPERWRKNSIADKPKNMILIFDIPEAEKWKRNWLRFELGMLGFTMLQKSVWFGPAPLPKAFIEKLDDLELLTCIRFFNAKEADIV